METHKVAIIGLGRIGTVFLEKALFTDCAMDVVGVCEIGETKGRRLAEKKNIPVMELADIVGMGVRLDVIFDLTGDRNVSERLCALLEHSGNTYTQVAPNRLARLVWSLIAGEEYLPDIGKSKYQTYADMLLEGQKLKVQAG